MHLSKYSEESPTCFWARGVERGAILKSVSVVINVDFNILQHLRTTQGHCCHECNQIQQGKHKKPATDFHKRMYISGKNVLEKY